MRFSTGDTNPTRRSHNIANRQSPSISPLSNWNRSVSHSQSDRPAIARAEKKIPKALVLSCIDYRILEAERYFLSLQNLGGQYDFVSLAGASLALSGLPHQYDAEAFWDQLDISYRLHQIKKVMILDHEDCSVYEYKIDPNLAKSPELELTTHTEYLSRAYWAIRDRYPDLNIELYFVKLNTEVKQISPLAKAPTVKIEPKGQVK
jgi:carbonic anhydrase